MCYIRIMNELIYKIRIVGKGINRNNYSFTLQKSDTVVRKEELLSKAWLITGKHLRKAIGEYGKDYEKAQKQLSIKNISR